MNKTAKVLVAYVLGNAVQIVLHALAKNTYMARPILFCAAAGFLVFAAVVFGAVLSAGENKQSGKHYAEYVENDHV